MTLPAALVVVPVHGKITDPVTGAPGVGYIQFRLPQAVIDTIDKTILGLGTFKVDLDVAGEFTINLPATDTPGFLPTGWAYETRVYSNVWRVEKLFVQVPYTAVGTLELADLIQLNAPPSQPTSYLPLSGGQLLGSLHLAGDPTTASGAATKQYVDAQSGIRALTFEQAIPISPWVIRHNLGFEPNVSLEDIDGNEFDAQIYRTIPDVELEVRLSAATSGYAYLS